jgi:hypothetical protein
VPEISEPGLQRVASALNDARRELIDITRRNRLLHTPRRVTGTGGVPARIGHIGGGTGNGRVRAVRPHCLEFLNADLDLVFSALRQGKAFSFDAEDTDKRLDTRSPLRLRTELAAEALEKRLLRYFREARVLEEEQGVNILFMVFGFLKWFEDTRSDQVCWAPLILVPVTLERRRGGEQFVVRGRDEDLIANVSLRERLRLTSGIELPEFPEEDEWPPSSYFDSVNAAIASEHRWSIDTSPLVLASLPFRNSSCGVISTRPRGPMRVGCWRIPLSAH